MDIEKIKKINDLAKSLKDSGLAATMDEGIKKAKGMVLSEKELDEDSSDEVRDKVEEVRDVIEDAEKGELPAEAVEAQMGELIEEIDEKEAEEETVEETGPSAQELIDETSETEEPLEEEPKPVVEDLKEEKTCPECGKKGFFSKLCGFCGSLVHKEKELPEPPKPEEDIDEHIVKEDYV